MNREREISKFLHLPSKEELKLWTDKIYTRFPVLPHWSVGAFFAGVATVGQQVPRFLVPEGAWGFLLTHLKATFQSGTLTGETRIDVSLISKGKTTFLGPVILTATNVPDEIISVELAHPQPIEVDDLVKWDCTAAGGHAAITAYVVGRQKS